MEKCQIFISYRRDGGEFLAGRLSDRLTDKGYRVFYDVESMRSGLFNEQIYLALEQCEDVLLVLPPHALDRCKDPEDWVRKEIEFSLEQGKNIIPILMRGFTFPPDLPESIASVAMCEGVAVDSTYFDAMIERIGRLLRCGVKSEEDGANEEMTNGIRFLKRRLYTVALQHFEKVIQSEVSEPDAYFYAAAAKLEGKRPFLLSRRVIGEAENYLESAIAYGERAIYYYFYAFLKRDHYEKKMLRSLPSSAELVRKAQALGLEQREINELFELLNLSKEEAF